MSLFDLRKEYRQGEVSKDSTDDCPFAQFKLWFEEYKAATPGEPNVMSLATATKAGDPSVRLVLLKDFSKKGFTFFTDYNSRKGRELEENPKAALVFFWEVQGRQVRINGVVEKLSRKESTEYFHSRPKGSQVAASVSSQSQEIENREAFINRWQKSLKDLEDKEVPCPDNWGGYRVIPKEFEFWQGRPNRLHDRICYSLDKKSWKKVRRQP